jgi:hypothetical protein
VSFIVDKTTVETEAEKNTAGIHQWKILGRIVVIDR